MVWTIAGIIAGVLLIVYFGRGRNAVWGGLTLGVLIGLLVAFFSGFDWYIVLKGAIVGVLIGFGAELLSLLTKKI